VYKIDIHDVFNALSLEEIEQFTQFVFSCGFDSAFHSSEAEDVKDAKTLLRELLFEGGYISFCEEIVNGRTKDADP
jgi:hypothetical protein